MLDKTVDVADDPIFAFVREARPVAPASLERDVLARLALPERRPSRRPIVVGCAVAVAAIVCIVLLLRRDDDPQVAIVVDAPSRVVTIDAREDRAAPPIDAPPAPPRGANWTDLTALWSQIEHDHRGAIEACGPLTDKLVIKVQRRDDGTALAMTPITRRSTALEYCRLKAANAIQLPPMPADLLSIDFVMPPKHIREPKDGWVDWLDPLVVIRGAFASQDLAGCMYWKATVTFVVDRTHAANPRVSVPPDQFGGKDGGFSRVQCMDKLFAKMAMPALPPFLLAIRVSHHIAKP